MKNSWSDINRETQSKKQATTQKNFKEGPKITVKKKKKYKSDWGDKHQKAKQENKREI